MTSSAVDISLLQHESSSPPNRDFGSIDINFSFKAPAFACFLGRSEMESTLEPQQTGTTRPPQHEQPSKRRLKLQRWESHRDEIYDIYVVQNQTLQATMRMLKEKHDFVPR
jgi:Clr5 domain